jgi:succinate dehydrogenase flavin-adding protein (antitoxin of CptAB toxin-antitoxin module)
MANKEITKKLEKALSEYLDLLEQDKKIFPLTMGGEDEPKPTKYMLQWIGNNIKLQLSEKNLIKVFEEYKKLGKLK